MPLPPSFAISNVTVPFPYASTVALVILIVRSAGDFRVGVGVEGVLGAGVVGVVWIVVIVGVGITGAGAGVIEIAVEPCACVLEVEVPVLVAEGKKMTVSDTLEVALFFRTGIKASDALCPTV